MKLHHIGYLVKNVEKTLPAFEALGYEPISLRTDGAGANVYDETRQCYICFLQENSGSVVELIAPAQESSPVWGLLNTYKNAPYHLCFECGDLEAELTSLQRAGWMVFQPLAPAPAIDGKRVIFLVHRSAGIIELVENR